MLQLIVLGEEYTVDLPDGSVAIKKFGGFNLELEHSLVALSRWESKFQKPFLDETPKTGEEIKEYIKAMAIHPRVPEAAFESLDYYDLKKIQAYMDDSMTATFFHETKQQRPSTKVITNELIYYWMAAAQFPIQMENWHLRRLFTALRVASVETNSRDKKMSRAEALAEQRRLNQLRRQQYETGG